MSAVRQARRPGRSNIIALGLPTVIELSPSTLPLLHYTDGFPYQVN